MSTTKTTPRFLPTLTEVVHQPARALHVPASGEDALVERVTQRAMAALHVELGDVLRSLVDEHVHTLAQRLQEETERAVRLAVAQALAEEMSTKTP